MDWIKRNLYFLIGSLVAVALMGLAGWYLYSKWQLNNTILGSLDEQYATLRRLYEQKPHPGSDKVDNIKAAKDQQQELLDYIRKARQYFQVCPPIPQPESGKLTSQEFSSALSRTIDQMQRDAARASVELPPKDSKGNSYSFSFAAQKESLAYAPGSLEPLSVQLGKVKVICAVLFAAKVNSLDNLRRERVSEDDNKGPQTDYLSEKSVTNELAVLTPYEVTFRCFSHGTGGGAKRLRRFAFRPGDQDHQCRSGPGDGGASCDADGRSHPSLCCAGLHAAASGRAVGAGSL